MLVKTLKRMGMGFLLGLAVGNLIAVLTGHEQIVSAALLERIGSWRAAYLLQTLLSGLIGAASFAGISLYEIDRWPLLLTTLVHYLIYMAVFFPIAVLLGWLETAAQALWMALILAGAHFLIFLIICAVYRARMRELNKMQKKYLDDNQKTNGGTIG